VVDRSKAFGFGIARFIGATFLDELAMLATEASGIRLQRYSATSYRALADAMITGQVGVAWLPPILALEVERGGHGTVAAIPLRHGVPTYRAAIIVRPGGPKTIGELAGTRVAWVDAESAAGYVVPRLHLAANGFDVRAFAHEEFLRSHIEVVNAVSRGRFDVGATFSNHDPRTQAITTAGWTDVDGRAIRDVGVLATVGPIPNDALLISSLIPLAARLALTRWVLDPPPRVKRLFSIVLASERLRAPEAEHFQALRDLLRKSTPP